MSNMAKSEPVKLTKRSVDATQPGEKRYIVWDSELKGFGLRVLPSGVKTYIVIYRAGGGGRNAPQREFTIGRHGPITPDAARAEANRLLGRVRLGGDPADDRSNARAELLIADLCDLYLKEGVSLKKASTIATDKMRIERHIKPLLGRKRVSLVTNSDVERFMRDIAEGKTAVATSQKGRKRTDPVARGGRGTASRTTGLLGAIFTFAVRRGMRPDNPVHGIKRYKDRKSQRYLSSEELAALGVALENTAYSAKGRTVVRLLVLTGARKSEIEALRWESVDFQRSCLQLRESKTGEKVIPIGAPALSLLRSIEREDESPFVFPSASDPMKPYVGTPKVWRRIRADAGLPNVRLHDLRHSYASIAAAGGQSLQLIGKLLGHRDVKTTAQYAHLADDPAMRAADRTSDAANAALSGKSAEIVTLRSS